MQTSYSSPQKKGHGYGRGWGWGGQDSQQVPHAPSAVTRASGSCFPADLLSPAAVPLQRDFP